MDKRTRRTIRRVAEGKTIPGTLMESRQKAVDYILANQCKYCVEYENLKRFCTIDVGEGECDCPRCQGICSCPSFEDFVPPFQD